MEKMMMFKFRRKKHFRCLWNEWKESLGYQVWIADVDQEVNSIYIFHRGNSCLMRHDWDCSSWDTEANRLFFLNAGSLVLTPQLWRD